ncbi:MAG: valine--tRNA ligase [Deltaproteobacteria bacterium]|nr:valine--tRNA ligase [Deltaproteobacteria bacterium]MBI3296401.1 valine--tRNA ligase [Deltaproteobacteria bacterium]
MKELPPQYLPQDVEKRIYEQWMTAKIFEASETHKKSYTILMPPPNVTGVLHIGHALTCTLEDVLTRWKRMLGFNALWLPGTDHAGIATQMVVERKLFSEEKKSRHDLGREEFLKRVWQWKEESQTTIHSQIKMLGSSVDWTRLRFTLDDQASRAVRECFVRLFHENLIYRDEAMISWCPRCRTALSDLEVKFGERKGKLWHIRYALKGDAKKFLVVATTRPETLLGDTAVAVHPDDKRYKEFHGKTVVLPLMGREIPVICDEYVDKEFGTGALKITPGHDPNDYAIGKKHKLPILTLFDDGARINEVGGIYKGLSREKGRDTIVEDLKKAGLFEKEQDHSSNVGACDRCQTVVEPRVSRQWFVKAEVLAAPAIKAVEDKRIRIVPEEWEKTYFNWMRNIRPWCISRQLWWGHRIPVWYCGSCSHVMSATETPKACDKCRGTALTQDEDVLDTWFSSGLWPLSTLGWPDETEDLKRFYPSDVMETGFDILFFWVARMVMLGMHFKKEIPFHTVYLHPMVRDEFGQKMSKTKGNVKDPLEIIHTKGADALRFTLCAMAVHGRDVLLSDARIEGYRNFVNKLWNATRFVIMHFGDVTRSNVRLTDPVNGWILTRLNETKREMNAQLEQFRFDEAATTLYHFVWNDYCDYFIEFIKRKGEIDSRKGLKDSTALEVLEEILRLAHPIIPFVTEELWSHLPLKSDAKCVAVAQYPVKPLIGDFPEAQAQVGKMIEVMNAVRRVRGENNVANNQTVEVRVFAEEKVKAVFRPLMDCLADVTGASRLTLLDPSEELAFANEKLAVVGSMNIRVALPQGVGGDAAGDALRELQEARAALKKVTELLGRAGFADKAPAAVVLKEREKEQMLRVRIEQLEKTTGK